MSAPGPESTPVYLCDPLTHRLRIWQRVDGHKATSDDVLLAWLGATTRPDAKRCLDLGTGKGTVAMLLSQALSETRLVGVEAFPESHALALRNIEENGLAGRFEARLGDLRDATVLAGEAPYDLVTGAPPFMRVGSGVQPRDPQRAAGRFELRGGVEAYVEAAAAHLAPAGACVILMDGGGGPRAVRAFERFGLCVTRRVDVVPRPGRAPTYALVVGERGDPTPAPESETLAMRVPEGDAWSEAFAAVRRRLDLPGS